MAKYMMKASYTAEGTKGLTKDGGSARRAAVQKMIEGLGGRLECFYYTFGESDAFAIVRCPGCGDHHCGELGGQRDGWGSCINDSSVDARAGRRGGEKVRELSPPGSIVR